MRARSWLVGLVLAVVVVLMAAAPAAAHAELLTSSPADGEHLTDAPTAIELRFSEPVEVAPGAVRMVDRTGTAVTDLEVTHDESHVTVVPPPLADGGYVVSWRIVSVDTHPVSGAIAFTVGDDHDLPGVVAAAPGASGAVRGLLGFVRFVEYASLLVVAGVAIMLAAAHVGEPARTTLRRVLVATAAVVALGALAGLGLQAANQAGGGLGTVVDATAWRAVLDSRFGHAWVARGVLALAISLLGTVALRRTVAYDVAVALGGVALLATVIPAGHSAGGRWRAIAPVADAVHLLTAAVWVGGLVTLVVVATRAGAPAARALARRFSPVALVSVILVSVSGTVQAVRQHALDGDALIDSRYGRLLVLKVVLVLVTLVVASRARRATRGTGSPATLRTIVALELVGIAAVIAVTAALAAASPPHADPVIAPAEELAVVAGARATLDGYALDVQLAPAVAGSATLTVRALDSTGAPVDLAELDVSLTETTQALGPLRVAMHTMDTGYFMSTDLTIPYAGEWRIDLVARRGELDQQEGTVAVTIR